MIETCKGSKTGKRNDRNKGHVRCWKEFTLRREQWIKREMRDFSDGNDLFLYLGAIYMFPFFWNNSPNHAFMFWVLSVCGLFHRNKVIQEKKKRKKETESGGKERMTERNWDREKYTQVAVEEVSRSPAQLFLMLGSPEHFLATQCSNFMSTASCPFSSVFFSLCLYGDQYFPVPTPLCQSTGFLEALLL